MSSISLNNSAHARFTLDNETSSDFPVDSIPMPNSTATPSASPENFKLPEAIFEKRAQSWPGMSEQLRLIDKWTPAGFALSV